MSIRLSGTCVQLAAGITGLMLLMAGAMSPGPARAATVTARDSSSDVAVLVGRADAALAADQPSEALSLYDRALALAPRAASVLYGRALAMERLGRTAEAASAYRAVLRLEPDHGEAIASLASLRAEDDPAAALADLHRLQARRPDNPWLAGRIGLLHAKLGDWAAAATQLEQAAAARPDDASIIHNLAVAYDKAGRRADAVAAYERVLTFPAAPGIPVSAVRDRLRALREMPR